MITDMLGRGLNDLRVSVTDRCNFRCTYCMPREQFGPDHAFLPRADLLTFEEITRIVRAGARHGVQKVRLTGGEPLLRRDLHELVRAVSAVDGITDVAMTSNGALLSAALDDLVAAGLDRVTISLDALDQEVFAAMADVKIGVETVVAAVDEALARGLGVKINTVVQRGVNESQILPLAAFGRERGVTVRFIEFMDVGTTNGWDPAEVVTADEIITTIGAVHPLSPVTRPESGGGATAVADRFAYEDGAGEVGVIASVSQPFCRTCVRARLSSVGELFTCLFATSGHDLRALLRSGADDDALDERLAAIWGGRADRYSELRADGHPDPENRVEMSYIGG